tara:strand:- start:505 stop:756 length:252 start_codon:yes stop_codon:yes gene_type:complete
MNEYSDAYPEVIVRLNNENKYLKSEKKEEKGKLENTIKILRVEIESLKEKKRLLENELSEVKIDNKLLASQLGESEKIKEKFQ